MKDCYINGLGSISAQRTYEGDFLEHVSVNDYANVIYADQPSYKEVIPPAAIRRMAKGVKMGIYTSNQALKEAMVEIPDAIITGTGMGCVEDSDKFLKAIIDNNEQFLTPTSFIQSTHNTVGAQIALGLQCKGYNFTYVNGAVSFESALLDAKLQLEYEEVDSILVGGIDETSQHTIDLYKMVNIIKRVEDKPFSILNSKSNGVVLSEGASFFVIETEPKQSSYAVVKDISIYNELTPNEVSVFIIKFLAKNNLNPEDIDVLVLGKNGDFIFDNYYEKAESAFNKASKVYYKHLSGEYSTVSAFGLWVAAKILKRQKIPQAIKMNTINKEKYDYVLLYNQYRGKDHSLILLKKC